ncbi:hypothetical protein ACQR1I_09100 [Bradyrhizobium sp. HKCCYLS2038]|uniref:hypothetical protein n=1 Tax=unclassified Bradyrhizobium TaxID=2631580 RepID=UPI003EBBD415
MNTRLPEPTSDAPPQHDDWVTIAACGMLAATLAAVCHETIGHGLGCLAAGGDVTLLTSIWFRCHDATSLTDAGGAIAGVICGGLAMTVPLGRIGNAATRLAVLMFGAISLLWVAAQLISHPAFDRDDWHFIAARMHWPWMWRPTLAAIGVVSYAAIVRWIVSRLKDPAAPGRPAIRAAYVASALSAACAGLMWSPQPIRSAAEGLLTLGVAPLGLLLATRLASAGPAHRSAALIMRSWSVLLLSVVIFAAFALIQARGLGPLATVPLAE